MHVRTSRAAMNLSILYILSDDLGVGDVTAYRDSSTPWPYGSGAATPNIDGLASGPGGVRFTSAYAGAPVCAPSRFVLMTGLHAGHIPHALAPPEATDPRLNASSVTIARVLKTAGYRTALIGKWGLDDGNPKPADPAIPGVPGPGFPLRQGFDDFIGQDNQWECHNYFPPFLWRGNASATIAANANASIGAAGCGGPELQSCAWASELFTDEALKYVRARGAERRADSFAPPFFLYLAYTSPHAGQVGGIAETEIPVPALAASPFADARFANGSLWPRVERQFATAVADQDAQVGRVLAELDAQSLAASTVVMFTHRT
jgi:arylsulfatase A-like enzyme